MLSGIVDIHGSNQMLLGESKIQVGVEMYGHLPAYGDFRF